MSSTIDPIPLTDTNLHTVTAFAVQRVTGVYVTHKHVICSGKFTGGRASSGPPFGRWTDAVTVLLISDNSTVLWPALDCTKFVFCQRRGEGKGRERRESEGRGRPPLHNFLVLPLVICTHLLQCYSDEKYTGIIQTKLHLHAKFQLWAFCSLRTITCKNSVISHYPHTQQITQLAHMMHPDLR